MTVLSIKYKCKGSINLLTVTEYSKMVSIIEYSIYFMS
jgi:hypothetical protein